MSKNNSLHRSMYIKATIVAYVFSVQYFENATIVAYADLSIKLGILISMHWCGPVVTCFNTHTIIVCNGSLLHNLIIQWHFDCYINI